MFSIKINYRLFRRPAGFKKSYENVLDCQIHDGFYSFVYGNSGLVHLMRVPKECIHSIEEIRVPAPPPPPTGGSAVKPPPGTPAAVQETLQ